MVLELQFDCVALVLEISRVLSFEIDAQSSPEMNSGQERECKTGHHRSNERLGLQSLCAHEVNRDAAEQREHCRQHAHDRGFAALAHDLPGDKSEQRKRKQYEQQKSKILAGETEGANEKRPEQAENTADHEGRGKCSHDLRWTELQAATR